jgi:ABC-type antimicrobial peptide transport system permease subunit
LRLYAPKTLDETLNALMLGASFFVAAMGALAIVALALSAIGMYSLMSFTVSQRTREIGIRSALGADAPAIVGAIVRRALLQVGIGAALGVIGAVVSSEQAKKEGMWLIAAVAGVMMLVGLIACFGPLRRAMKVQPTDALRAG